MPRVFYDEHADPRALDGEVVAVMGYGIQGRSQALTLRDSGVRVVVGNRADRYRERAAEDGFAPVDPAEAVRRATIVALLVPDEVQPAVFTAEIAPALRPGSALVFAHGFALTYGLIQPGPGIDVMLLAPRLPGPYLRERYLQGWGIPAYVSVECDATGRAWARVLGLAHALGITRCAAIELSAAQETELDLFSEHFTFPLIFRALEVAFDALVEAGYPAEAAIMDLHGSGELGQVLLAAAREGLDGMIASHASPACQVGMAAHWESALGEEEPVRARIGRILGRIRDGSFAQTLLAEQPLEYPTLADWRRRRPAGFLAAERRLRGLLRPPPSGRPPPRI